MNSLLNRSRTVPPLCPTRNLATDFEIVFYLYGLEAMSYECIFNHVVALFSTKTFLYFFRYKKVAYLDTDVGQPEFTAPGCVSLHILDSPVVGKIRYIIIQNNCLSSTRTFRILLCDPALLVS